MNQINRIQARNLASQGRGKDTMLLHVTPREMQGLAGLAHATGQNMTINPATGIPEAGWFETILPMIGAAAAVALTGGTAAPMMAAPLAAGLGNAGTRLAMGQSLEQSAMGGLMAGGMAGMGGAMGDVGAAGAPIDASAAAVPPVDMSSPMQSMAAQDMAMGNTQAAMNLDGGAGAMAAQNAEFAGQLAGQPDSAAGWLNDSYAGPTAGASTPGSAMNSGMEQSNPLGMAQGQEYANAAGDSVTYSLPDGAPPAAPTAPQSAFDNITGRASADMSNKMTGIAKLAGSGPESEAARAAFAASNGMRYGLGATVVGMGGLDSIENAQKAAGTKAAKEADQEERLNKVRGRLSSNYTAAGRAAPAWLQPGYKFETPYASGLAKGGSVKLESGGFVVPKYAVDAAGHGSNAKGLASLAKNVGAKPIRGKGTGTSDSIPAVIDGKQAAKVSNGEAYVPKKKVKAHGGTKAFYNMLNAAKQQRAKGA
jgi:hypothetical protein